MSNIVFLAPRNPPVSQLEGTPFDHVLSFDNTLSGHRLAKAWLVQHPDATNVGRVVVPYCNVCKDFGTHTQIQCKEPIMAKISAFARCYVFAVEPLGNVTGVITAMEEDVLLRDPLSGLSKIQTYIVSHTQRGDPLPEVQAAASVAFHMPIPVIREQCHMLEIGNSSALSGGYALDIMPHALVSGPHPVDPASVCRLLKDWFNKGDHELWSTLPPYCPGYVFERQGHPSRWVSVCKRNGDGDITGLPYGVSRAAFARANPMCDKSTNDILFDSSAQSLLSVPIEWDGRFLGAEYPNMNDYMTMWIKDRLIRMALALYDLKQEAEKDLLRRDFIRTIYAGEATTNRYGDVIAKFLGESTAAKLRRIDREFGGHVDFLDIRVGDIGDDAGLFVTDDDLIPMSGRDLWISKLPY